MTALTKPAARREPGSEGTVAPVMTAFLPQGGRFNMTKSPTFVEAIMHGEAQKPGPGTYNPVQRKLPEGGRFNRSNPKSDIDWLVHYAKDRPGPGEYAPKRLSSDGGIISRARTKSALEWQVHRASQLPGPGQYAHDSMPLPEGGRFNRSRSKSALDTLVQRASRTPGPGEYDAPRWPCPSHGRFAAPKDAHALLDHLAPQAGADLATVRPFSTLDQYRDGSFRLAPAEKRKQVEASLRRAAELGQKMVGRHTREHFAQLRIERAKLKGQGTAEDAIDQIFDFLDSTRAKVMDVFQRIDKDGNGELDMDEFRLALQMMGLDVPRSQAQKVVQILDEDGNGVIDVEEFVTKVRSCDSSRLGRRQQW
jgi:hypothetical protein